LKIPSISSGGGDPAELTRAAQWARDKIVAAGGTAEVQTTTGNPLVVGRLTADADPAPTVMIYGHYDVQSPDPLDEWTTPPFDPTVRNGRIYARGAADDKGNFFPLLYVACELKSQGRLPVTVRILVEGEEEVAGDSAVDWVAKDPEGADCAIVFDSEMLDPETPALTLGVRGIVAVKVEIRTARANLHSGLYGGSVLNAAHVLNQMMAAVLPGPDGLLRAELREGVRPPSAEERAAWANLPDQAPIFEGVGARPIHEKSAETYYAQNWAEPSIDINGIASGDAVQQRTIVPATATCRFTMRLAADQDSAAMAQALQRLLRDGAPQGTDVTIETHGTDPAAFDPSEPALVLAVEALTKACGRPPALIRSGGSIPVLAAFAARGIPTILSGFTLPEDAFHAPDESFREESLRLCEVSARELYAALARLSSRS
jgi:acetylornithine deacetylase/succinyl-diaminopimelate desuccinylase-like protein